MNKHHRNQQVQRTIFIRHDQLLDDINAQIDLVMESRMALGAMPINPPGTSPLGISPVPRIENASERYASQIERFINKYIDLSKSRMAAYIVTIERTAAMNAERPWEEAIFHFTFPPTWNHTTFTNLADAIHQYIVNSVLKEFFILVFTSKDPIVTDKISLADEAYSEMKHCCVSQIPGAARKTLKPF